jgi:hypothetical protein
LLDRHDKASVSYQLILALALRKWLFLHFLMATGRRLRLAVTLSLLLLAGQLLVGGALGRDLLDRAILRITVLLNKLFLLVQKHVFWRLPANIVL